MACECISYNRPDLGGSAPEVVRRGVCLDACIADQIEALWQEGIETGGCCCGHRGGLGVGPSVFLKRPDQVEQACRLLARIDTDRDWTVSVWSQRMEASLPRRVKAELDGLRVAAARALAYLEGEAPGVTSGGVRNSELRAELSDLIAPSKEG